jgi:hypothetical protein
MKREERGKKEKAIKLERGIRGGKGKKIDKSRITCKYSRTIDSLLLRYSTYPRGSDADSGPTDPSSTSSLNLPIWLVRT